MDKSASSREYGSGTSHRRETGTTRNSEHLLPAKAAFLVFRASRRFEAAIEKNRNVCLRLHLAFRHDKNGETHDKAQTFRRGCAGSVIRAGEPGNGAAGDL
jgi:hypothetical protein